MLTLTAGGKSAEEWTEELSKVHFQSSGYIASYHAERKDVTVDALLASDVPSGELAVHLTTTGGKFAGERKFWTQGDRLFIWQDGVASQITGMRAELKFLLDFQEAILPAIYAKEHEGTEEISVDSFSLNSNLMLQGKGFTFAFGWGTRRKAFWAPALEKAVVKSSDDELVTFETTDSGVLTIGRKSGMITHQETNDGDEKRVMVLKSLTLNPGKDAVRALSKDWEATTPRLVSSGAMTGVLRTKIFQSIVDQVESGNAVLDKVDSQFDAKRDELRQIARDWVVPGPILDRDTWKLELENAKKQLKAQWLANVPNAKIDDGSAFEAYLAGSPVRQGVRDRLAVLLGDYAPARAEVVKDLFPDPLVATSEAGEAVRALDRNRIAACLCGSDSRKEDERILGRTQRLGLSFRERPRTVAPCPATNPSKPNCTIPSGRRKARPWNCR
ncbi:MAG: hypothetical protein QM755_10470 [Luteolibacter sp.]